MSTDEVKHSNENEEEEEADDRSLDCAGESSGEVQVEEEECWRRGTISEDEDVEKALQEWIDKGRNVTSKGFAKRFPGLTRDLRQGKLRPEDIMTKVDSMFSEAYIPVKDLDVDFLTYSCHQLIKMAIPPLWWRLDPPIDANILHEFRSDLRMRWLLKSASCSTTEFPDCRAQVSCWLQEAFDEACRAWAPRLDMRLPGGQRLSFLKRCPAYGVSETKFAEYIDKIKDGIDRDKFMDSVAEKKRRKDQVEQAVRGVSEGLHELKKTCWECQVFCEEDLQQCSRCRVACYCGRDCQVKAWKGGHKHKCDQLREKYAKFEETFKIVDAAHETGLMDGIQLSDEFDYRMAHKVIVEKSPFANVDGPSIQIFYANLARVSRGEWWFYDDADPIEVYREKKKNYTHAEHDGETSYSAYLALLLSFDFVKSAVDQGLSDLPVASGFDESSDVMILKRKHGYSLPVERFMEIYQNAKKSINEHDKVSLRWRQRVDTLKELRRTHHK